MGSSTPALHVSPYSVWYESETSPCQPLLCLVWMLSLSMSAPNLSGMKVKPLCRPQFCGNMKVKPLISANDMVADAIKTPMHNQTTITRPSTQKLIVACTHLCSYICDQTSAESRRCQPCGRTDTAHRGRFFHASLPWWLDASGRHQYSASVCRDCSICQRITVSPDHSSGRHNEGCRPWLHYTHTHCVLRCRCEQMFLFPLPVAE